MNEGYLNSIIEAYSIDYIIHGDDPCLVNGQDVYASAKKLGILTLCSEYLLESCREISEYSKNRRSIHH